MALATPIIPSIFTFDATEDAMLPITYPSVGDTPTKTSWQFYNSRGYPTYGGAVVKRLSEINVTDEGKCVNGNTYVVYVRSGVVVDGESVYSGWSDPCTLVCYAPPTIEITNFNLVDGVRYIDGQNYTFTGTYTSADNIDLKYYYYVLYDENGNKLHQYDHVYTLGGEALSQDVDGLASNATYKLELICVDQYGNEYSSGEKKFVVNYISPQVQDICRLTNNCEEASVTISSNLRQFKLTTGTGITKLSSSVLDLVKEKGAWLDCYIAIPPEFTLQIWGYELIANKTFLKLSGSDGEITVYYDAAENRLFAKKSYLGVQMIYRSEEPITVDPTDGYFYILIRQHLGRLDLIALPYVP